MIDTEWKKYLVHQAAAHPSMEPQDVFKLIFQAAFGAEHLLMDKAAAYAYLEKEYEAVSAEQEPLYEQIQANRYRVNLRAWKMREMPIQWLFRMFVSSVERHAKCNEESKQDFRQENFTQYIETAKDALKEGAFAFSYEEFLQYTEEYEKAGPRAVHHSEGYRAAERPAYRLVNGEYVRLIPILEAIADCKRKHAKDAEKPNQVIIAIDGRCASGKSTMAHMLSEITGAGVVHMDDFYLPMELRTKERLAQPGGNVHYERFQEEVLTHLKAGNTFAYRRFDCSRMQLGEYRKVENVSICVVEGAYSCHPVFGEYADVRVFSHVEPTEQLRRIKERDGEAVLSMFKERWIPMEEKYFAAYHIMDGIDMIV